ncbi:hypothetical protein GCM10027035_47840 [Emticicia sediminis]
MLSTKEIIAKYGEPGDKHLVTLELPYPMRIAWDTKVTVKTVRCHDLIAPNLMFVFVDLLEHYGYEKIKELGIDLFGGIYNYRKMRGGNDWSRHSWGIAIDLDPARNGLKVKKPKAQFSRDEYKPMIDIFYKYGFVSYGREKNYDWMHFEIAE